MDLMLRDHLSEMGQDQKTELDEAFLNDALSHVKTLLIGGTGTTSDTVCFGAMLLSAHPEVVRKLREEHDRAFTPGIEATFEMLKSNPYRLNDLVYTTNVIKEILRFYPIGNTARRGFGSLTYNGREYTTEGFVICPVQFTMHMDPKVFPSMYTQGSSCP